MPFFLRVSLIGLLCVLVQWLFLGRLHIGGAYADGVLLYVAWVAFMHGRRAGMLAGFGLGLLMDAIYDTWGIHMFVKTLLGFVVGMVQVKDRDQIILRPDQAFLVGLLIALLHNGLLVFLLVLDSGTRNPSMIYSTLLGSALYTAVIANIVSRFVK